MSQYEVLTDTHKIQVADHEEEKKWVFNKNHRHDGSEISIGTLNKIVHSTEEISLSANAYENVGLQDVPEEIFDFLDEEGYHTENARNSVQF